MKKKVFVSFDYENDKDIKYAFMKQAKILCPYAVVDQSILEPIPSKWKNVARERIKTCDYMIVLCGEYTKDAKGVAAEVTIVQEENIPYFLIKGRPHKEVTKPLTAYRDDKIYKWTWKNINSLLDGK